MNISQEEMIRLFNKGFRFKQFHLYEKGFSLQSPNGPITVWKDDKKLSKNEFARKRAEV